ncbi:MAG: outer membrane beta-barrel protein [Rhodobacteraceae bacterium]|nr:outer membrane beta-barrel protein [Paracoccaceae bacterium]
MKHIMTPVALGLSAAFAGPALAGGYDAAPAPAAVAAPAPMTYVSNDWSGGYAGVQLGYANVDATGAPVDGDGGLVGVHAGYRWDTGNTVYGVELDYDNADINLDGAAKLNSVARLKGQIGYDMGQTLLYGTAGVAYGDTTLGNETGYLAGVGMAYAISPSMTLGAEVLYHDFDEFGNSGVGANATTATIRASFRF